MTFEVPPDAYDRFMGRFSRPLAREFAGLALPEPHPGWRVLDVGCGPGILTGELVARFGAGRVAAIDPSEPFVAETQQRWPLADVRQGRAEQLPWPDDAFDAALAQLVVHFMTDPVAGVRQMARVTRGGGPVAACVWDHGGGGGPLSHFWSIAARVDPLAPGEARLPGCSVGELVDIFERALLVDVREERIEVALRFATFEEWWDPFTFGVGPAGDYVRSLDEPARNRLVAALRDSLPQADFAVPAAAWCAIGTS